MNIVVAPDAYKGTLTQKEAAEVMKRAINSTAPHADVVMIPMADGGEGTADALVNSSSKSDSYDLQVTGPCREKITTNIMIINGDTAIIEVAKIVGLPLVPEQQRNPYNTTTFGIGEAIICALDQGIRQFIISLGGSATNDGGIGMLQALGAQMKDKYGKEVSIYGRSLREISSVDLSSLDPRIGNSTFQVVTDVKHPLYGPNGATETFGPQKGATKQQVQILDQAMEKYSDIILRHMNLKKDLAYKQGAGAAGGLGFAWLLLGGKLVSGASFIAGALNLEQEIRHAQFVLTGEGKSDEGTVAGKAPGHVAKVAKKYNVPCILISGTVDDRLVLEKNFTEVHTLVSSSITEKQAMENPTEILYKKTKQIIKEKISW